jgi:hypothetical protein
VDNANFVIALNMETSFIMHIVEFVWIMTTLSLLSIWKQEIQYVNCVFVVNNDNSIVVFNMESSFSILIVEFVWTLTTFVLFSIWKQASI